MRFLIRNSKDFWSGLTFICIGAGSLLISADYERGSAGMMGPGYFPSVLGVLLALIGVIAVIRSTIVFGTAIGRLEVKKSMVILLGILSFGVLVRNSGLAAAVVVLIMIAGYANAHFSARRYLVLALCMAAFCVLIFVHALGLPIPAVGGWLSL